MTVYMVEFWDGNSSPGETEVYLHSTARGAKRRVGKIIDEHLNQVKNPETRRAISVFLSAGDIEAAYTEFVNDGGSTGMLAIETTKVKIDK